MRLLLVDPHSMFGWLVQELVPRGVTVERVDTLADASETLLRRPIDLAMFGLTAAPLPWEPLDEFCRRHDPPIPIMYYSTVHRSPSEADMPHVKPEDFFTIPIAGIDLRNRLADFVAGKLAEEAGDDTSGKPPASVEAAATTPTARPEPT